MLFRSLLAAPAVRAQSASETIPPEGIGTRIRHLSYSDQGGRPDGVQVMYSAKTKNVFVGHMFSDGVTVLDASDPRNLKPLHFFTAGAGTRTHQMQNHDDILLLANGANIVAMQSYNDQRGYFENKDRKSTRLNSSHVSESRMPSSA